MSNNIVFGKRKTQTSTETSQHVLNLRKPQYSGVEARDNTRRKSLKECKIIFNNNNSVFDGVILNLSDSGAKIKVENSKYIANDFILRITFSGVEKPCSVRWRNNNLIGVEFDKS